METRAPTWKGIVALRPGPLQIGNGVIHISMIPISTVGNVIPPGNTFDASTQEDPKTRVSTEIPENKRLKIDQSNPSFEEGKRYPKPKLSYAYLVALALKNSADGRLTVPQIYKFIRYHFPYYQKASPNWRNSIRHTLSHHKDFEKAVIDRQQSHFSTKRKNNVWTFAKAENCWMEKRSKDDYRIDPIAIRNSMSDPDNWELIHNGEMKIDFPDPNDCGGEVEEDDFNYSENSEGSTSLSQDKDYQKQEYGNLTISLPNSNCEVNDARPEIAKDEDVEIGIKEEWDETPDLNEYSDLDKFGNFFL